MGHEQDHPTAPTLHRAPTPAEINAAAELRRGLPTLAPVPLTPFPSRTLGLAGLGLGLRCAPLVLELRDARAPKSPDERIRETLMRQAELARGAFESAVRRRGW